MGHAAHFLERLERLDPGHLDEALALYREPRLAQGIARWAARDSERVALDLSREGGGPYVVLARDGGFVTCLGRGMSPGELPVVPRARFEGFSELFGSYREAMVRLYSECKDGERPGARVVRLHAERGHRLTREEFGELEAVRGLHLFDHVEACLSLRGPLFKNMNGIVELLPRKFGAPRPTLRRAIEKQWKLFHAFQQSAVLAAIQPEQIDNVVHGEATKVFDNVPLALFRQRVLGPMFRALWIAARTGRWTVDLYREDVCRRTDFIESLETTGCLAAIASHHLPVRGHVLGLLDRLARDESSALAAAKGGFAAIAANAVRQPQTSRAAFFGLARELYRDRYEVLGSGPAPDEVSEADLLGFLCALQAPMNLPTGNDSDLQHAVVLLMLAAPWIGELPAGALYPPEALLPLVALDHDSLEPAFALYRMLAAERRRPEPARRERPPGRNDPCPCGSGRKYKRCCLGAG